MAEVRVIPTLLLQNDKLIKTRKFKKPIYIGDPINAIKIFNEKEVDELIILDIKASKVESDINYNLIKDMATESFFPLGYGGGINSEEQAEKLFKLGIEKIILNSYLLKDKNMIKKLVKTYGSQSIVVAIDVKKNFLNKYYIFNHVTKKKEKIDVIEYVKSMEKMGAGEIYLNSVDRDGTLQGYDIKLLKIVSENLTIPVIAAGGASSLNDFKIAIEDGGVSAVSAGSFFVFQGKHKAVLITYPKRADLREKFKYIEEKNDGE